MSDFQRGVVVGVVSVLAPIVAGVLLALAVDWEERSIRERARKAGL